MGNFTNKFLNMSGFDDLYIALDKGPAFEIIVSIYLKRIMIKGEVFF